MVPGAFHMRRIFAFLAAVAFLSLAVQAQDDQPSLGDVARQARAQKRPKPAQPSASPNDPSKAPSADAQPNFDPKDAAPSKTAHVITEDELFAPVQKTTTTHSADSKDTAKESGKDSAQDPSNDSAPDQPKADRETQAEQWKEQILAQKESIAQLERAIAEVGGSIHFVGGNCVQNCEQWNQNQQRKQSQVESMKAELQAQQQHLEEMQDAARKQGFGSNVYDQ